MSRPGKILTISLLWLTPLFNPFAKEAAGVENTGQSRPHVLWILIENIGPEFSCYGYPQVQTPHIDALAAEGALYQNAFTNGPVCSPSRSSLITGMYQNAFGAHHHRSYTNLPDTVKTLPELFREAGYFTALGNGYRGKTDY